MKIQFQLCLLALCLGMTAFADPTSAAFSPDHPPFFTMNSEEIALLSQTEQGQAELKAYGKLILSHVPAILTPSQSILNPQDLETLESLMQQKASWLQFQKEVFNACQKHLADCESKSHGAACRACNDLIEDRACIFLQGSANHHGVYVSNCP